MSPELFHFFKRKNKQKPQVPELTPEEEHQQLIKNLQFKLEQLARFRHIPWDELDSQMQEAIKIHAHSMRDYWNGEGFTNLDPVVCEPELAGYTWVVDLERRRFMVHPVYLNHLTNALTEERREKDGVSIFITTADSIQRFEDGY